MIYDRQDIALAQLLAGQNSRDSTHRQVRYVFRVKNDRERKLINDWMARAQRDALAPIVKRPRYVTDPLKDRNHA